MRRVLVLQDGEQVPIQRASKRDDSRVAKDYNLCFENSHLSKKHALLKFDEEKVFVKDCFSAFGTIINSFFIRPGIWFEIEDGDKLGFIVAKPTSFINKIVSKVVDDRNSIPISLFPGAQIALKFTVKINGNVIDFQPDDESQGVGLYEGSDKLVNENESGLADSPGRTCSVASVSEIYDKDTVIELSESENDDPSQSKLPKLSDDCETEDSGTEQSVDKKHVECDISKWSPSEQSKNIICQNLEKSLKNNDGEEDDDSWNEKSELELTFSDSESSESASEDDEVDSTLHQNVNDSTSQDTTSIHENLIESPNQSQGSLGITSNVNQLSYTKDDSVSCHSRIEEEMSSQLSPKGIDDLYDEYLSDDFDSYGSSLGLNEDGGCCLQSSSGSEIDSCLYSSEDESVILRNLTELDEAASTKPPSYMVYQYSLDEDCIRPKKRTIAQVYDDEDDYDNEYDEQVRKDPDLCLGRKSLEVKIPLRPSSKRAKVESQSMVSKIFNESLKAMCYAAVTVTALGVYGKVLDSK